jgi:hypothetical protein
MSVTSYPLFVPPDNLAAKSIASWSVADANRYREWLLGSMPGRIAVLKSTLSLPAGGTAESILVDAGRKMVALLSEPAASTPGRREVADLRGHEITYDTGPLLSIHGYAIAADVGLLMAELLTDRYDLHWDVVRRPKRDIAYNLPALFGFGSCLHMEPVHISNVAALGVLDGSADETRWSGIYRVWADEAPPRPDS